jgi:hypothetical protein
MGFKNSLQGDACVTQEQFLKILEKSQEGISSPAVSQPAVNDLIHVPAPEISATVEPDHSPEEITATPPLETLPSADIAP